MAGDTWSQQKTNSAARSWKILIGRGGGLTNFVAERNRPP